MTLDVPASQTLGFVGEHLGLGPHQSGLLVRLYINEVVRFESVDDQKLGDCIVEVHQRKHVFSSLIGFGIDAFPWEK